ncbi:MAG TPA: LysM domain-containing protein [Anaerolineales bacterium]|nr:LysM domain-containing protein [Anaerolineales bacterium]
MNDQITKPDREEDIAQKLTQLAEHTHANVQFATELEERLRNKRQRNGGWLATAFRQTSPTLRWVALMALLVLVLSWSIRSLIPAPQPAAEDTPGLTDVTTPTPEITANETATPAAESEGYEWRSGKLYLAAPLPELPAEANVYLLKPDTRATVEEARALAQQFGIEGELYQAPGQLPDTTDYMITDGKQRLYVRSKNYFTYYADYNANVFLLGAKDISDEEAQAVINSFLKSHGFNFDYQIEKEYRTPGIYYVILPTPDGHAIRFDYNMPSRLQVTIGNDGQVISVDSSQIEYETVGTYGISSAEEAFQRVLGAANSTQNGVLESAHSGGVLNEQYWERSYPENQTITIYGRVTVFNSVDPGKPAFVAINNYTATGNTPSISSDQLIEATGQFFTENGIRKFNIESWQPGTATETSVMGILQREADQTILLSDMGDRYVITDPPADVPLNISPPDEQLIVSGVLADGNLIWTSMQYFPAGSNYGGGGGGGTGFYSLNLSGTPVPFPSPTAPPADGLSAVEYVVQENDNLASIALKFGVSVAELNQANDLTSDNMIYVGQKLFIPGQQEENPLVGRRLEKQRGTLVINLYGHPGINLRPEFIFTATSEDGSLLYALLENVTLDALLGYQNRPLDIWGTVRYVDENGMPVIDVEKYEAPYPGLQFQVVRGTQQHIEIDGAPVNLFTTEDGKAYVQKTRDGLLDMSIAGDIGDSVYAEALIFPDEVFGDYPVIRIFSMGPATDPTTGEPVTFEITADQVSVMDEALDPQNYVPPDATIEKVELVYYIPDPRYAVPDPSAGPQYIQPAWRFAGRYSNGDQFEILVQALKHEYLLPDLAPYTPPG